MQHKVRRSEFTAPDTMLHVPSYESSVLLTDDPALAARVSSLFVRPNRYFSVLDGPRMGRSDADNEVVRRRNAMVMTGARKVLMGGLPSAATDAIRPGWKDITISDDYEAHVQALRGVVKRPNKILRWGPDNLGVGLYRARLSRQELVLDLETSPAVHRVEAGTHLLVACEQGDSIAEVVASNLAYSCGASFALFAELSERVRESWLEELYALGEVGDLAGRFGDLAARALAHLSLHDVERYKTVLFVTGGFPWGIAVPQAATTHMYRYPDFGRAVVEGLWASQTADRTARTALLIDPQTVEGSEIPAINEALLANKTLTRVVSGKSATNVRVQFLLDLLPHDIIVLSTHAGDASGERITYEFPDAEARLRRLVVDQAVGIGYDPGDGMFLLTEYHRFHSLDGVDWRDSAGKDALPVGSAMTVWSEMDGPLARKDYVIATEPIGRVLGSMAIKLHDGNWFFTSHGFAPGSAPLIVNNSCWSWHELSERTTFAGARAYVGSLFPITDAEAQEIGLALFGKYIGLELPMALWRAQGDVYEQSSRRPYVMVGLPFVAVRPNTVDSVSHLNNAYLEGVAGWSERAKTSTREDVNDNARRYSRFLFDDYESFRDNLQFGRRSGR